MNILQNLIISTCSNQRSNGASHTPVQKSFIGCRIVWGANIGRKNGTVDTPHILVLYDKDSPIRSECEMERDTSCRMDCHCLNVAEIKL